MTPLAERLPVHRIGRYILERKLGEGGMGVVYRALDRDSQRRVALKVLPPELYADHERRSRFKREARAIERLDHESIARLYEYGEVHLPAGSTLFIAMELAHGRDLASRMALEEFDDGRVASIGRQIAQALSAAHAEGILHRDLKPANVHLDSEGKIKLLDFGLAKILDDSPSARFTSLGPDNSGQFETMLGMPLGTAAYSAPEQLRGEKADSRGDLFSLGVILFQLITGRVPFGAASVNEVLARVEKEPPKLEREAPIDPDLRRIVERLLAASATDRFEAATEVAAALEAVEQRLLQGSAEEEAGSESSSDSGWRPSWLRRKRSD